MKTLIVYFSDGERFHLPDEDDAAVDGFLNWFDTAADDAVAVLRSQMAELHMQKRYVARVLVDGVLNDASREPPRG